VTRSLLAAAVALALGGASAETASASVIRATVSVKGAGTVTTYVTPYHPSVQSCSQAAPVSDSAVLDCPDNPWIAVEQAGQGPYLPLEVAAAPGWTFAGWTGCPTVMGTTCRLGGAFTGSVQARFEDHEAPAAVRDLRVVDGGSDGAYGVRWTEPEPGLDYLCSLDGRATRPCDQQLSITVAEGAHTLSVYAIDPSGNAGPRAHHVWVQVDTEFAVAPLDGAHRQSAAFAAQSRSGDEFECSIDGQPYRHCGTAATRGAPASLTLPSLADGRHTLRVRARSGGYVDRYPATRTWTVDTTPPDTAVRHTATGFELSSNESGVTFRCRVDNGGVGPCVSPYTLRTPALGPHTFDAYAIDRAGNVDPTPARHAWTIEPPPALPAPAATAPVLGAPVALAAPLRLDFQLRHSLGRGRLTRLAVTGLTMRADLRVIVKCPQRKRCPRGFAKWNVTRDLSLTRLLGKRLPRGTKITVRARSGPLTATRAVRVR
jgi:hypothetical protein